MEADEAPQNTEELVARHRQERKDLQSKVTALRKTVPKNDKKKKKEVSDTITKLEDELNERHRRELNDLQPGDNRGAYEEREDVMEVDVEEDKGEPESPPIEMKLTRAQRRRNKKESEDKERNKRISEQEKLNKQGPRNIELNSINEMLKREGLQIHTVPADGNCLYCSIKHQLETSGREVYDVGGLRKLTADFIRDNKDDFLPFMYNESEEVVDEVQFEKYCSDVASTKLWGGQLELRALSNILKCPIKVIQASGPATIQGEQFEGTPLTLTYHRHLYRLGEHYNSTAAIPNREDSS